MINIKKQIQYWETGSDEELLNAKIMIDNNRHLAGLFFCHLCLEKILKALVVKETEDHPVRTHHLSLLAEKSGIDFDEDQDKFISKLQLYQLEGRYPEMFPSEPDTTKAKQYFEQTVNLHKWLKAKL